MRWPLMFTYDHLLTLAKEAQAHAEQMFEELRQRNQDYRDLLDKYHALKLQGAVAVPTYTDYIETPLSVDEADALRVEQEQEDG